MADARVTGSRRERPIIFSAESVRAILDGRKTQTRRLVKPQPNLPNAIGPEVDAAWQAGFVDVRCPFGVPGDRLWVRETWWAVERHEQGVGNQFLLYDDEWHDGEPKRDAPLRPCWPAEYRYGHHPSIHIPRWASRLTLEIESVRVQRLQEISEEDAKAEGVPCICPECGQTEKEDDETEAHWICEDGKAEDDLPTFAYRVGFERAWDVLNGKRAPWDSNPWVWAISFKVVR